MMTKTYTLLQDLEQRHARLLQVYDKENSQVLAEKVQQARATNANSRDFGRSEPGLLGLNEVSKCHAVLGNQQSVLASLEENKRAREASLLRLRTELAAVEVTTIFFFK